MASNDDPWGSSPTDDIPPWEINSNQDSQVAKRTAEEAAKPEKKTEYKEATVTVTENKEPDAGRYEGVTVTFKGSGGYDQPWIVVHAADTKSAMDTIATRTFADLIQKTQQIGAWWKKLDLENRPATGADDKPSTPPEARKDPSGATAPTCEHGEMTWVTGTKNGNTWGGHFCPLPKDAPNKCKPVWKK